MDPEYWWWWNLLGLLLHIRAGLAQSIAILPQEFTASLNRSRPSEIPSFTCSITPNTTSVSTVNVLVNGVQFNTPELESRGIIILRQGTTMRTVFVEPRMENNNTVISCVAVTGSRILRSLEARLLIQGLLSSPSDLEISSIAGHPYINRLSWQPPFTLNITNLEPDIVGYRVCFTFMATQVCTVVENTLYEFFNVRLTLDFLITAINIVGEGDAGRVMHPACATGIIICSYISKYNHIICY